MLSAQCDELRRLASTLDTRYRYADDIVTALLEAADTILSLRDRAQELQAENAKLRDGAYAMRQLYEDELKHAMDENAKLRKLVRHMYECMCNVDADGNYECYSCEYENTDGNCDFERRMQELGVEVDDGAE